MASATLDRIRPGIAVGVARVGSLADLVDGRISGAALAGLLSGDAGLRLLVTAREPIRVRAEHRWPVGPLNETRRGDPVDEAGARRSTRLHHRR